VQEVPDEPLADPFEAWEADLHGHRVIYHAIGDGPPVVLMHGMLNSSRHWRAVAIQLADAGHRVIAPDLIGHGDSATPRGDYSLGAHAAAIRDLLVSVDIHRATFVGHSLGAGVAMQFFWQFPERVERLALISAGGLGGDVSPPLRAAALPGVGGLIWAAAHPRSLDTLDRVADRLEAGGKRNPAIQTRAIVRALRPLERAGGRKAFLETLRAVIDIRGQRVSANDRLYLLGPVPTLVAWGDRDRTIPVEHGRTTAAAIPNSRFELIEGAAHFPHLDRPEALAACLARFIAETEPHAIEDEELAELLATRTTTRRRHLRAA
jgi:pimeloyl-ACP methyl ester carboxylesterase